jgi:hypothetical protein
VFWLASIFLVCFRRPQCPFFQGLKDAGFVEGRNINIEIRQGGGWSLRSLTLNAPREAVYRALLDARGQVDGAERDDQPRARLRATRRWFILYFLNVQNTNRNGQHERPDRHFSRAFREARGEQASCSSGRIRDARPSNAWRNDDYVHTCNAEGGTDVLWEHNGIPRGVSPADNELGSRMALTKLATLVEAG